MSTRVMGALTTLLFGIFAFVPSTFAGSKAPIVYQGRILSPSGAPINTIVNFRFTIKSPTNCVLWSEDQTIDMRGSSGGFSARIGEGVNIASGTHGFSSAFTNSSTISGLTGCDLGSDYVPNLNDDRSLFVSFNDGTGTQNVPTVVIKSVPFASEASSAMALRNIRVSATAPTSNQVLRYNSVSDQWEPHTPAAGGSVTSVDLTFGGGIFNVAGGPITTAGTLGVTLATQAQNTVFAAPTGSTGAPSFRLLDSSDIPSLPASKIGSGTLGVNRGGTGVDASSAANGQILIGNGTGFSMANITAGTNVIVTNSAGGITISATSSLPDTAVTPGSYGSGSYVSTFTVDQQGRLTAAGSASISIDGAQITSGTLATAVLGVVPGANGGTVTQVNTGAGLEGGPFTNVGTISLGTSGVAAGSYGSASWLPNFVVDIYGRLTSAGSTAIAIDANQVSSGTLAAARLGVSGVTAGSYGSGTFAPTFSVDQYGRLTAAGSTAINASQWTNIALGINYGSGGSVGIGVAAPAVKLDIDGAIKIANDSATCAAGFAGAIRYSGGFVQYCDGVTPGWVTLGVSGSGLQSLNGLVANNQIFAVGSAGTLAAFTSGGSLHTLDIPMASTSGAVGGLISNADYLTLTAGTIPAARVGDLPADKITSGTLATAVLGVVPGANGGTVTQVNTGAGLEGGPFSAVGTISLGTSGVAAGSYGSASWLPNFVVDIYGRLTSAGSTAIAIDASQVTGGTLAAARLGIVPAANGGSGLDGSAATNGQLLIGNGSGYSLGTITAGSNITVTSSAGGITIASTNSGGTVTQVNTGTGLSGGPINGNGTISLADTAVTADAYGSASQVSTFTVDQQGRLTAAGTVAINIDAAQVGSGTLATARLGASGVVAGTVNSTNYIPTLSVDTYGRVTTLGSTAVSFPALQWTDVALGINYGSGGSVGIGVAAPAVKLDVAGAIKIANDTATCSAGFAGAIRYNGGLIQYCDGSTPGWITLGVSGSGLQSLNGLVANNQLFAVGSAGTLAAFTSGGSLHTLDIPMASTSGAVGGLLSNSDYLSLTTGTIPAARVGDLPADKITSGTFAIARIPDLDASKIVSGTLATAILGVVPGANGGTVTQVNTGAGLEGGPFSAVGTISLGTSGVAAGSYGSAGWIPTYTVDTYGRITSTSTVEVSIDASRVTGGTLAAARLGVVPAANGGSGLDGSAAANGQLLIGNGSGYTLGTITAGSNITVTNSAGGITIASSNGGGTVTQVNTGTGLSGGPISGNGTISLTDTAVAVGAYGSASQVSTFTVDQQGRLTAAGTVAINIDGAQVGSGTLATARLGVSGVTAGSYGSGSFVPTFSVDQYGRLTAAGSTAITSSQWTNVALGINYGSGGSVGIGVAAPAVKLDIDGAIKIANDSAVCAAGFAGAIRYNGGLIQYCDGSTPGWITLGVSGSGLQSLNGLVANNQLFAVGSSGTLAAFTSGGSLHTLNIPLASTTGAVGGLLSNADYLTLTAGTIPSTRIQDLDAAKIVSGTLAQARLGVVSNANGGTGLDTSAATAGQLLIGNGSGLGLGTLTAGSNITITNANGSITIASTNSGGTVTQVNTGAGLEGGPFSAVGTISLGTSGVSAGSYGSASWLPNFVVDIYGRLTSAGSTQIAIDASQVTSGTLAANRGGTGLVPSAGDANRVFGVNNAGNGTEFKTIAQGTGITVNNSAGTITISTNGVGSVTEVVAGAGLTGGTITSTGTLALSTTGVGSGTVGAASFIPQIGFDAFGRITSVGSVAVAVNMSSLSGTLGVAQGGTGLDGSAAANGALLIGNGSGYTLGTLTYSNGVLVSNTAGTINLATNAQTGNVINTLITRDGSGNFAAGNADLAGVGIRGSVSGTATLTAPNSFTNYSMVLPANMGTPGQVLRTDGTSQLSWTTPSSGITYPLLSTTLGSVGTPVYSFSADPDSGLYSPGVGTLALSTNGTLRLSINSNGRVGIGTGAPATNLDVVGDAQVSGRVYFGENIEVYSGDVRAGALLDTARGDVGLVSGGVVRWSSGSNYYSGVDTGLSRNAAGVVEFNNGTPGTLRDIQVRALNPTSGAVGVGTTAVSSGVKLEVASGAIKAANGGELRFGENISQGANYVGLKAPGTLGSDVVWTLPTAAGTSGQVLSTDGTNNLSWITPSSGVTYPLLSTTLGSVGTPVYSFSADSDTGMWSPSANALAFSVGGTQQVSISGSGLGVVGRLEASGGILMNQGPAATDNLIYVGQASPGSVDASMGYFVAGRGSTDSTQGPYFLARGNSFSQIASQRGNVFFYAGNPSAPGATEGAVNFYTGAEVLRMTINNAGNIGMGTSSVSAGSRLEVTGGAIKAGNGGELRFGENISQGANYVGLKAAGTLGSDLIWTLPTSAGTTGQVLGTDGTNNLSWITPAAGGGGSSKWSDNAVGINYSSGSVGIGTTAPEAKLQVSGGNIRLDYARSVEAAAGESLLSTNAGGTSALVANGLFNDWMIGSNSTGALLASSGSMSFTVSNSTAMTIKNGGSIGIGTTNPNSKLHIVGNPAERNIIVETPSGWNQINVNSGGVHNQFGSDSGTGDGYFGTESNNPIFFRTNDADRMRIHTSGSVGIGIGGATPNEMLSVAGGLSIDYADLNSGTLLNALRFGLNSGEAISSKRTATGNQYGLDFYTTFTNRMAITVGGSVGIGTTAPAALTEIASSTAAGNTIVDSLRLSHVDSNTGGVSGIGTRITFTAESASNGVFPQTGVIESVLDDATNTSKDSSLRFFTLGPNAGAGANTATEKLRVGSGSVAVSNASFSAISESAQTSVNSTATLTMGSLSAGNIYRITLTADATITLPLDPGVANGVANIVVILTQDGVGSRAVTFVSPSGSVLWDQGFTPTACTTIGAKSIFQFMKINGDNDYYGSLSWKACP